jgi:hypothetical protein
MGRAKVASLVALAAFLGAGVWAAYRGGWGLWPSRKAPIVEYRELHFGGGGQTGRLVTIDSANQVSVLKTPLAAGSTPIRGQLSCYEVGELPDVMKEGFIDFRRGYGTGGKTKSDEASLAYRWGWIEKRAIWRNPPSGPQPPIAWDKMVSLLDNIEEVAEDAPDHVPGQEIFESDIVFEYGHLSSGIAGSHVTLLAIDRSGAAGFVARAGGRLQLAPEEFARLMRTVEDAKFTELQQCYGRYAPVNPQSTWMWYRNGGKEKEVTWMSPPADPKPPEGWSRITEIVDPIEERLGRQPPVVVPQH